MWRWGRLFFTVVLTCLFLHLLVLYSSLKASSPPHTVRLAGSQFPDQGLNLGPQQWKQWVLTTGSPGDPQEPIFYGLFFFLGVLEGQREVRMKKKMAGWWCWTKRDFGEGKEHSSYALKLSSCLMIMLLGQHHGTFDRQGGGSVNEGLRSLRKTRGGSGEWGWRERYKHVVHPWNNGGTIQETMSNCLPLLPQWVKTGRSLWHTEGCPFQPTGPMMIAQNN